MTTQLKIDFVSDVSCPWCAVGLGALEAALARVAPDVTAELHFQPFELNPQMPAEGQDINEHLIQKYGSTPEQLAQSRAALRARGVDAHVVDGIPALLDALRAGHFARVFNILHGRGGEDGVLQGALQSLIGDGTYGAILKKWNVSAGAIPTSEVKS